MGIVTEPVPAQIQGNHPQRLGEEAQLIDPLCCITTIAMHKDQGMRCAFRLNINHAQPTQYSPFAPSGDIDCAPIEFYIQGHTRLLRIAITPLTIPAPPESPLAFSAPLRSAATRACADCLHSQQSAQGPL